MFDNLRDDAAASFYEDADTELIPEEDEKPAFAVAKSRPKASSGSKFLGMTPVQRFVIAFMLMIAVCALGTMCLLMTGKIGI